MPEEDVYERYCTIILSLSKKFSSPVFEPHVTLYGQIDMSKDEILRKTSVFARPEEQVPVLLSGFDMQTSFYRALSITVEMT